MKFFIISFLLLPVLALSQVKRIGRPNIINHPKTEYKAGTQNWGCAQDPDGFMYYANNDGLLRFDGLEWKLFQVSNTSPIRSLCIDKEGTIFIGLDNDFGIFDIDASGGPAFKSLFDKLPPHIQNVNIIWKIHDTQDGIVFQSFSYIFILEDDEINIIRPEEAFHYSFYVNKRLFFHEPGIGLFELINGFVNKVPWADDLKDMEILSIISFHENQLLIGTAHNGWFEYKSGRLTKWDAPVNHIVEKDVLFCATKLYGNNLAIGTILNGLIIVNSDGAIIQHLNTSNGLQNNTILSLHNDRSGNLWLGLDNGVDYIELNSPLSYISGSEGISTGYCCTVFKGMLYLGTNRGLFAKPFNASIQDETSKFKLVDGTEGQVWRLKEINNQLVCAHNFGAFIIDEYKAHLMDDKSGTWTFVQLKQDSNYVVAGNYSGLSIFHKEGSQLKYKSKVKGIATTSLFITEDKEGNIWICDGAKSVIKVRLNEELDSVLNLKYYGIEHGLPNDFYYRLLTMNKTFYISTVDGLYIYNGELDRFEKDKNINTLFDLKGRLKFVEQDEQGSYWYITENETGVIRKNENGNYTKITSPFKQLRNKLVHNWEFLYIHNTDNVFIGTEVGFAHYSSRTVASYDQPFKCFVTQLDVPYLDTVIYTNFKADILSFPFKKNSFRFKFAAPFYQNPEQLEFSYFIDNYSEKWSNWSSDNFRDISNLHESKYVFRIKAKNSFGIESEEASFTFIIDPPWHRSNLAYFFYVLLLIAIGLIVLWVIKKRFEISKQIEQKKHREALLKTEQEYKQQSVLAEKEIIRLRNEKLTDEKLYLDKELANQTLHNVNKNKFLMKINQELKGVSDNTKDGAVKTKMVILRKRINKEIDSHHQKQIFESHFEAVHSDFFARLKEQFPQLSPKDIRLCAYIKMNMSSKEIAPMLNISERGVEISRYRLRKKLDLSRDINLSTFLLNL